MYENAMLPAEGDLVCFVACLAGIEKSAVAALAGVCFADEDGIADSESDALSQASSSAHSTVA